MRDIVVIGASSGGIQSLSELLQRVSPRLKAAIFVVQHLAPDSPGTLPRILGRSSALPVVEATDCAPIQFGVVHVAPPDLHMLLLKDEICIARGARENRHRPSIDVLFRSAAVLYRTRVIGVVLSGRLDDGSVGLAAIKQCGGLAVVQNPTDALFSAMPTNALNAVDADYCVSLREIPSLLERLVAEEEPAASLFPVPHTLVRETEFVARSVSIQEMEDIGDQVPMSCPACAGPLWQMKDGPERFRCHAGHAFSIESMTNSQDDEIEEALDVAWRALREKATLLRRLGDDIGRRLPRSEQRYYERADELEARAAVIHKLRTGGGVGKVDEVAVRRN